MLLFTDGGAEPARRNWNNGLIPSFREREYMPGKSLHNVMGSVSDIFLRVYFLK